MPVVSQDTLNMASSNVKYVSTMNGTTNSSSKMNNGAPGRLNFPDIKIRDLPFYPVKATLLRPCAIAPKDNQVG